MDFASWKDRKAIAAALKTIYRGKDTDAGRQALDEFDAGPWGKKYPAIAQRWRRNWEHVIPSAEMEIEKWRAETGARNPPRTDRNAGNCRPETGARQPNLRECRGETGYRGAGGVPQSKLLPRSIRKWDKEALTQVRRGKNRPFDRWLAQDRAHIPPSAADHRTGCRRGGSESLQAPHHRPETRRPPCPDE
jgi:hypothetical protein